MAKGSLARPRKGVGMGGTEGGSLGRRGWKGRDHRPLGGRRGKQSPVPPSRTLETIYCVQGRPALWPKRPTTGMTTVWEGSISRPWVERTCDSHLARGLSQEPTQGSTDQRTHTRAPKWPGLTPPLREALRLACPGNLGAPRKDTPRSTHPKRQGWVGLRDLIKVEWGATEMEGALGVQPSRV